MPLDSVLLVQLRLSWGVNVWSVWLISLVVLVVAKVQKQGEGGKP